MNIYHRIYKLYKKRFTVQQIAATTNMPLKSVKAIIRKLNSDDSSSAGTKEKSRQSSKQRDLSPYLDAHVTKQHTHVTIDFSGFFTAEFTQIIRREINQVIKDSSTPQIVLKISDIFEADTEAFTFLKKTAARLRQNGRTIILFSPPENIEASMEKSGIEKEVKVLGTRAAFDKYIYSLSSKA
ncbi:MAG: STAS domain-containing protein [Fibrobacterota bacterium]